MILWSDDDSPCCHSPYIECWICQMIAQCKECGNCQNCGEPIDEYEVMMEAERRGL